VNINIRELTIPLWVGALILTAVVLAVAA